LGGLVELGAVGVEEFGCWSVRGEGQGKSAMYGVQRTFARRVRTDGGNQRIVRVRLLEELEYGEQD
jgi:hypothetical protein